MGFSTKSLLKYKKKNASDGGFDIFRVEYSRKNQIKVLTDSLYDIFERSEELIALGHKEDETVSSAARCFQLIGLARSVSNKHSSFQSENEWRIALFSSHRDDSDLSKDEDLRVRVRGSDLIPYLVVNPAENGKLPLVSIGVGPGFSRSNQTDAVRALCRSYDYTAEIYNADTPYTRD